MTQVAQTAKVKEYAEQIAVPTRLMYAAPNRRTTHRLAALDLPVPTIMRAPGRGAGMFALESAMDELAQALRARPDRAPHPQRARGPSGVRSAFSSRNVVACLRQGADRFGWAGRDPAVRSRRDGRWLVGTGVAASSLSVASLASNAADDRVSEDGRYTVAIGAADIGTGAWTALRQIAADALEASVSDVELQTADTILPAASSAGFSSWHNWVGQRDLTRPRTSLRAHSTPEHAGVVPPGGLEVTADMPNNEFFGRYACTVRRAVR